MTDNYIQYLVQCYHDPCVLEKVFAEICPNVVSVILNSKAIDVIQKYENRTRLKEK